MAVTSFTPKAEDELEPDDVRLAQDVLEEVWQAVQLSGATLGAENTDAAKQHLAKFILELVTQGERDRRRLGQACLTYVARAQMR